jgi:3D (Asp-Asp-Asp) domain-containing protein
MAGSVSEVIRLVYELSVVDKGTKKLLDSERAVQRETKQTARAMAGQDTAVKRSAAVAEQAARREQAAIRRTSAARRKEEGLIKRGAAGAGGGIRRGVGLVAGIATVASAEKAVSVTEQLAKTTLTLHKSFGIAVKDASRWAAVSQARGADGKQMTMGFKALATQVRNATQAQGKQNTALDALREKNALRIQQAEQDASHMKDQSKARQKLTRVQVAAARSEAELSKKTGSQLQLFEQLGISQQELVKHGNDMNWVLKAVSDGLAGMPTGTDKAAVSAKLFGRTWTTIAPLVRDGSKALEEQLHLADKYGATMGGETVAELQKHIKAEREAKLATLGLQVAFGTKVAPTLTNIIQKTSEFAAQMHSGAGAGGRFARQAREIADDLTPVWNALKTTGKYLAEHPRLVVAAAAAYASFKAVRGTVKIAHDIADIGAAITKVGKRASKTKLAELLADGAVGANLRIRYALNAVSDTVSSVMSAAAARGSAAFGASKRWKSAGRVAGRAAGAGMVLGLAAMAPEANAQITKLLGGSKDTPTGFGSFLWNRITGKKLPGGRGGGVVGRFAGGGLVPLFAAGGEMHVDGGRASMIPGDPRSDSTLMFARPGSAIITADGQDRMAAGASLSQAIASQAPHFVKGGRVSGRFMTTAYGPPWGGIQGGGTTATGVNLRRSPHVYGVAVDPSVIPLGTQVYASPNPFGRTGPFRAFDTGGAIKGNRLDFYDWRGRKRQNAWGRKMVRVSSARLSGSTPQAPADEDVTARIPLSLSPSKVRAGLVQDAVEQGIAAGAAGLKRKEIARAAAGGRGARRNPTLEAIAGALTPTTREVTLPGTSTDSSGGRFGGPLPGGVTVPSAAWNPAKRPIAKWIVPYLSWAASASRGSSSSTGPARRGGGGRWSGTVTSGFRSRAEQTRIWNSGVRPAARPGSSNHEGSTYPRGAVDVTQASMLAQVLRGKPGPHLLQYAGAKDPVHFSHPHGGSYRRGGLIRRMARGGVVGGRLGTALTSAMSFKGGSFDALDAAIGGAIETRLDLLRGEVLKRVRRGGDKKTVQRLQSVIDLIDFELGRRIGRYQDIAERRTAALERAQGAADRGLRLAGMDPGSIAGVGVSRRMQAAETKVRAQNVASLTKALAVARRTGNQEVIRDAVDKLNEARDAAAESLVRQVELWRDQLRAIADERTANAQFRTSLSGAGGSILESWQRTAGVQDTAQSMVQRAGYATGVTLPALEQQRQAAIFAAEIAAATGDVNGWRSAVQDAAGAAADIANAQADAADLIRAAAMKVAQDVVDAATHGRTMADLGLQRLDLEQQLIGTHDTTGGAIGRADFIRAQIIPAIQGEISALVVQLAAAQVTGDKALATQIGEAIYAKQNDVLEQQLAAQNAIKDNTDLLKEFGGSQAFSYQSQTFTDLDAIKARVGA